MTDKSTYTYKFNIQKGVIVREFIICATSYIYDFRKYSLQVDDIPLQEIRHEILLMHDSFNTYGNKLMFPKEDPPYKKLVRCFSIPVKMFVSVETIDTSYGDFSFIIDLYNPIEDLNIIVGFIKKEEYENGLMSYQYKELIKDMIYQEEDDDNIEEMIINVTI